MRDFFLYIAGGFVALVFIYIVPRLGSIAYFRSKAEYDRLHRRPLNGEHDAKE